MSTTGGPKPELESFARGALLMLPLIEKFVHALESEGVIYCHWKSNKFLADAARGEDDLDLLVSHTNRQAFLAILGRLGFKEAPMSKRMFQIPGILNYYGYDDTASRLIHVHVHYKLILGHDLTKNYHLPVEKVYLESSSRGKGLCLPAPECEYIVFIIRMMLKHSTWSAILNGQGKLSLREQQEMEYLRKSVSEEQVGRILSKHFTFLNPALFDDCIRALQPSCPAFSRIRAGQKIQKALEGCALRHRAMDIWLQFWRRLTMGIKRHVLGIVPGKSLKSGGMLVAFVGGDGAGKTTVIEGIAKWLSPPFPVMTIHMGKPRWSWITVLVRGSLKIGRILGFWPFTREAVEFRSEENPGSFPGYPTLIRAVCTARDRYLTYRRARRHADRGILVICDRFPLPGIISVDGPQVEWMTKTVPGNRFIRFLTRLESKYYRSFSRPDILFVLKANPDAAVERKSDENAASVRARSKEIWEKEWEGLADHVIDANQTKTQVLHRIKKLLWADI